MVQQVGKSMRIDRDDYTQPNYIALGIAIKLDDILIQIMQLPQINMFDGKQTLFGSNQIFVSLSLWRMENHFGIFGIFPPLA